MTTNYLDRLDPALIRPGRIDLKQEIGYATQHQLRKMFTRFYPNMSPEDAQLFSDSVIETRKNFSVAQIQGHFLLYKNDPTIALEAVGKIE